MLNSLLICKDAVLSGQFVDLSKGRSSLEIKSFEESYFSISKKIYDIVFIDTEAMNTIDLCPMDIKTKSDFKQVLVIPPLRSLINACRYSNIPYLVTPVIESDFEQIIEETETDKNWWMVQPVRSTGLLYDMIKVPVTDGYLFINIHDIVSIEMNDKTALISLTGVKDIIPICKPLTFFKERLDYYHFIQIEKGVIINPRHLKHFRRHDGNSCIMDNKTSFSVTDHYLPELNSYLNHEIF